MPTAQRGGTASFQAAARAVMASTRMQTAARRANWTAKAMLAWEQISDEFYTYRTVKVVKVRDRRIVIAHKLITVSVIFAFVVYNLYVNTFCNLVSPEISVQAWLDDATASGSGATNATTPAYCNANSTQFVQRLRTSTAPDAVREDDDAYAHNFTGVRCVSHLRISEISKSGYNGLAVTTFFTEDVLTRQDADGSTRSEGKLSAFVQDVERHRVNFAASFRATFAAGLLAQDYAEVNEPLTRYTLPPTLEKHFRTTEGSPIMSVPLRELIRAAHFELENRNLNSGFGCSASPDDCPSFRMTGARVEIILKLDNLRFGGTRPVSSSLSVRLASRGLWVASPVALDFLALNASAHHVASSGSGLGSETRFVERHPYGIEVAFIVDKASKLGRLSPFNTIVAMLLIIAQVAIVQTIMDVIGAVILDTFKLAKYEDDLELAIRGLLRNTIGRDVSEEDMRHLIALGRQKDGSKASSADKAVARRVTHALLSGGEARDDVPITVRTAGGVELSVRGEQSPSIAMAMADALAPDDKANGREDLTTTTNPLASPYRRNAHE